MYDSIKINKIINGVYGMEMESRSIDGFCDDEVRVYGKNESGNLQTRWRTW